MTSPAPTRPARSPEDVRASIEAFTNFEWHRVSRAAAYWARRYGAEVDDLMQEAIERAMDGTRVCPGHVSVVTFLSGTMRSISADWRKARAGRGEVRLVTEDGRMVVDPIDDRPNAAEITESRQQERLIKQAILDLFEGDLAAQTIVEGDMDGMEGEELRNLTGLDMKSFASKRRLIRRRIDGKYPKGWIL